MSHTFALLVPVKTLTDLVRAYQVDELIVALSGIPHEEILELVYAVTDEIHAVGDFCPHQKNVRLSEGFLDGDTIECPMHQSCFNVKTGAVLSPPAREGLPVFKVRIEDGQVLVEI